MDKGGAFILLLGKNGFGETVSEKVVAKMFWRNGFRKSCCETFWRNGFRKSCCETVSEKVVAKHFGDNFFVHIPL